MNSLKLRAYPKLALLGGSFNPPHDGHVHISRSASRLLGMPTVWMVTPQNPLKPADGVADFDMRRQWCEQLTEHYPNIHVSDIEKTLGSHYTVDTLKQLKKRFPHTQFVWLMGADNLAGLHRWERWQEIFELCPILVLDRSPFSYGALKSPAAQAMKRYRVPAADIGALGDVPLPAWGYVHLKRHPASSTAIRERLALP